MTGLTGRLLVFSHDLAAGLVSLLTGHSLSSSFNLFLFIAVSGACLVKHELGYRVWMIVCHLCVNAYHTSACCMKCCGLQFYPNEFRHVLIARFSLISLNYKVSVSVKHCKATWLSGTPFKQFMQYFARTKGHIYKAVVRSAIMYGQKDRRQICRWHS